MEPASTAGLSGRIGLRHRWYSAALEARGDFPRTATLDHARASTSLTAGSLVPCVHGHWAHGCAVLLLGSLRTEGHGLDAPQRDQAFTAAAGIRLGAELPLAGGLFLEPQVEALSRLTKTTLVADGASAWVSPVLAFRLGMAIGFRFPLGSREGGSW